MMKPTTRTILSSGPAASVETLERRTLWSVSAAAPLAAAESHPDAMIVPFVSIIPTPGFDSDAGVAGRYSGNYNLRVSGGGTAAVRSSFGIMGVGEQLNQVVRASAAQAKPRTPKFKYTLLLNTGITADDFLPFTSLVLTPTGNRTFIAKGTKNKHSITITGTLQKNNKTFTGTIKLTGPNQSLNATYTFTRLGPARG